MIKDLLNAFKHDGTKLSSVSKLIPTALKEMARIKANGNKLDFVKQGNEWYADIPNWPLDPAHLQMVAGADNLLDEMANGLKRITIKISQYKKCPIILDDDIALLSIVSKSNFAGTYEVEECNYKTQNVWLCPVINFVFGRVPNYITFKLIK